MPFESNRPEVLPVTTVTLPFTQTGDESWNQRDVYFSFADTHARVLKDGKEVGFVAGTIGVTLWVRLPNGKEYSLYPRDVWNALCAAEGLSDCLMPEHVKVKIGEDDE